MPITVITNYAEIHFTYYQGYVTNTNKVQEILTAQKKTE